MDKDGYPTEVELKKIENWPYNDDFEPLMEYVRERWDYANDGFWRQNGDKYYISTAGWSGNETIIGALQANLMFWGSCWQKSERGGHYVFLLCSSSKKPKEEE